MAFGLTPLVATCLWLPSSGAAATTSLLPRTRHLGVPGQMEWDFFKPLPPAAPRLDILFKLAQIDGPHTLFIRQFDVRQDWQVTLNGQPLGKLFLMEADLVDALPVPPGILTLGENTLSILTAAAADDILIHSVDLVDGTPDEAIAQAQIRVHVTDADTRESLPARVTVVDRRGTLAPLRAVPSAVPGTPAPAIRPGVAYTATGEVLLGLREGDYTVYASRGFEYGVASSSIQASRAAPAEVELQIHREVPTPGWVACDPHVHTFTHSGHGDATTLERLLTLAGEGIELPVATDHNTHTDYELPAAEAGVRQRFTPIIGNEVTTATAHFNIFPILSGAHIPDFRLAGWPALMQSIRATPDVRVIVLNHPLNVHNGFQPFDPAGFNVLSGENLREPAFDVESNAIELLNSSAQQTDFMQVYRGWFGLLNQGRRITGVGSSDSHDVSRYIVGQGRTYIRCPDADPGHLDVGLACSNLLAGHALISMGLLVHLEVDGHFGAGDLASPIGESYEAFVRIYGPSWVKATNVTLFANGIPIRSATPHRALNPAPGDRGTVLWALPRPAHDTHLVAIATGPAVTAPYWAIPRPYQPSSSHWEGRVIGSTNPVWLDADNDHRFTPAREYAQRLVEEHGAKPAEVLHALSSFDAAVAIQVVSLLHAAGVKLDEPDLLRHVASAPAHVRYAFQAYAASLRPSTP